MKHFILLILTFMCSSTVFAQDVIVKRDGQTIVAKVLEVGESTIKYKKYSNQKGPTYSISVDKVSRINYQNGDSDQFNEGKTNNNKTSKTVGSNRNIISKPSANNKDLLAMYNKECSLINVDKKNKTTKNVTGIFWISDESVLSTSLVSINIIPSNYDIDFSTFMRSDHYWAYTYKIEVLNNTDNMIFIDLGNTFTINEDGSYDTFYDPSQTTTTYGDGGGLGLNLGSVASVLGIGGIAGTLAGGVNLNGGSYSSTATTTIHQRVISIPPHGKYLLTEFGAGLNTKSICKDKGIKINMGDTYVYTPENTPFSRRHIICMSESPDFKDYTTLSFKVYLRQIFGSGLIGGYYIHGDEKKFLKSKEKAMNNHILGADSKTLIAFPFASY